MSLGEEITEPIEETPEEHLARLQKCRERELEKARAADLALEQLDIQLREAIKKMN